MRRYGSTSATKGARRNGSSPSSPGATVELSVEVKELDAMRAALEGIPEVDEARVVSLRTQIEEGTYKPDLEKIADAILQEAIQGTRSQE